MSLTATASTQLSAQAAASSAGVSAADSTLATALGEANNAQAPLFSPGQPLPAAQGIAPQGMPRQWAVPVATNVTPRPRSTEATSFEQLRNLARLYDGVQLCEKVYFDLIRQLAPTIVPATPGDQGDEAEQAAILKLFERPDGQMELADWAVAAMRDVLELDALAIYMRRNRKGDLQGLDLIDGSTIKPQMDGRGRVPTAPLPGYQQWLYGVPAGLYTDADILYRRENPRTDSPYGFSRVEMIVMRVNQALRKQTFDMARFTDGNVPAGLLSVPNTPDTTWTPEDIKVFEDEFNALLAGNDQRRNRIKVLPPGMVYTPTTAADLMTPFDQFLLNVTVGAFGLTMAELGFSENVNKSSGESLENVVYRRAVRPSANYLAATFTAIIRRFYGSRYKFSWQTEEEEDRNSQASRYAQLVPLGIASIDDYCDEIGQPKPGIDRFVMGPSGPVFFDVLLKQREQQLQALSHPDAQSLPPGTTQPSAQEPEAVGSAAHEQATPSGEEEPDEPPVDAERLRAIDLRRYEQIALKAVKAGRPVKAFASAAIPADELAQLRERLSACETADEVRAVFAVGPQGNDA